MGKTLPIITLLFLGIFSAKAYSTTTIPIRICTGAPTGMFTYVAEEFRKKISNEFVIKMITSSGAKDNIIKLLNNECDMALSLSDIVKDFYYEKPSRKNKIRLYQKLFPEYVHILCPTNSNWSKIEDIATNKGKLIIGPQGSGSSDAWTKIKKANPSYRNITLLSDRSGLDSIIKVKDSNDTCMLWVTSYNSPDLQIANNMSIMTNNRLPAMRLVDVNDPYLHEIEDNHGDPLYYFDKIERIETTISNNGAYTNLIPKSIWSNYVTVPVTYAVMMIRNNYAAKISRYQNYIISILQEFQNSQEQ